MNRSKFEEMLHHLTNEEHDKMQALMHEFVVEKAREIYEGILAEDFGDDEPEDFEDDDMDTEVEDDEIGGDETDDFIDDVKFGEDDEEDEDGYLEDRIVDLEDALDDLRAEFEELMAQEDDEPEHDLDNEDFGDSDLDDSEDFGNDEEDFGDDSDSFEDDEEFGTKESFVREYIEKVTLPKGGDDGQNTKSPVASANKMGGSSANIARGGQSTTGGTKGGLQNPTSKEENFGNINVPGGKAGKAFRNKVSVPKGGDAGQNSKSIIGGSRKK